VSCVGFEAQWNFRDEVMRRRLHGIQSRSSERPAHPIYHY